MKILFIGNRINVLNVLLEFNPNIKILALKESYLENYLIKNGLSYNSFTISESERIYSEVNKNDFDVLISNGCPFILPVVNNRMFNIHPTYLPELRGKTPLNGVLYNNIQHVGATMHRIDEGIDTGNIIYQQKEQIDTDIDLGLVYYLSFHLEGVVFRKGWDLLKENDFDYTGHKINIKKGNYFNRTDNKMKINFSTMATDDILRTIRAFGILTQGAFVSGLDRNIKRVFIAEIVTNKYLNEQFKNDNPGTVVLEYDNKILVKTIDGLIKLISYE